jgi:hypothetical protein
LAGSTQILGGVGFDVRGIIKLDRTPGLSIALNRPCRRIHFLHAASAEVYFAVAALYAVRYAGGDSARVELLCPVDLPPCRTSAFLRDAVIGARTTSPGLSATLAWAGTNAEVESRHETLFLTRTTWELPPMHRDQVVERLELRAGQAAAVPLIFAITVE